MKSRIVLFVEGEGEAAAMPKLVKRLLTELQAWDCITLDEAPFRVGQVNKLVKDKFREWRRKLAAAMKRPQVGGVLLVLDGDVKVEGKSFCVAALARLLAHEASAEGAGVKLSVSVVFAQREYESWLIAGIGSLAGREIPNRRRIDQHAKAPKGNIEESPRDAKGWLNKVVEGGYKPTRDQAALTDLVDLAMVRERKLRSFQRLENAVSELVAAIRSGKHVVTPSRTSEKGAGGDSDRGSA